MVRVEQVTRQDEVRRGNHTHTHARTQREKNYEPPAAEFRMLLKKMYVKKNKTFSGVFDVAIPGIGANLKKASED